MSNSSAKQKTLGVREIFESLEAIETPQDQIRFAEKSFEQIKAQDPQFKIAVEELLKITYSKKEWPKFFSYAQYYRKRWPPEDLNEVYQLELLALLRHCQNQTLEQLIESYTQALGSRPAVFSQILALSKTRFSGKPTATESGYNIKSHASGSALWKSDKKWIGKTHPSNLRVKVKNICDDIN